MITKIVSWIIEIHLKISGDTWAELQIANRKAHYWEETARSFSSDADFYRYIVYDIGHMIGERARIADDGSVSDSVLALKVPMLVKELIESKKQNVSNE